MAAMSAQCWPGTLPAEVMLRAPFLLETELSVVEVGAGQWELRRDGTTIATERAIEFDVSGVENIKRTLRCSGTPISSRHRPRRRQMDTSYNVYGPRQTL